MTFIGDIAFVEGRPHSKTTALVLRKCLGSEKLTGEQEVDDFLNGLSIKPAAFFKDIDADWTDKPFIGQHVFKVVEAAGYGGTEDDLWLAVTGGTAPYAVKTRAVQPKKPAVAKVKPGQGRANQAEGAPKPATEGPGDTRVAAHSRDEQGQFHRIGANASGSRLMC